MNSQGVDVSRVTVLAICSSHQLEHLDSQGVSTLLGLIAGSTVRAKNSSIQWSPLEDFAQDGLRPFMDFYVQLTCLAISLNHVDTPSTLSL